MTGVGPQREWFHNARVTYRYGRFGPSGSVSHRVHANLISIGDAGGFGTPVTLEGFRQALDSAKLAYLTIMEARNFSKAELAPLVNRFHAMYGRYYRMHEIVRFVYLHWMRNEDVDRWLANFAKMGKDDFFRLIKGELTVRLMLDTLDPILVKNILLNALNNALPAFARFRSRLTPSKKETPGGVH
jgi:flavin-dependent dehydrogenase